MYFPLCLGELWGLGKLKSKDSVKGALQQCRSQPLWRNMDLLPLPPLLSAPLSQSSILYEEKNPTQLLGLAVLFPGSLKCLVAFGHRVSLQQTLSVDLTGVVQLRQRGPDLGLCPLHTPRWGGWL